MGKIIKTTKDAIMKRVEAKETRFFVGRFFYEVELSDCYIVKIRRREQMVGRTPTSDWEVVLKDEKWL